MDKHLLDWIEKFENSLKQSDKMKVNDLFINNPPKGLEKEMKQLLTEGAIEFLIDLITTFDKRIEHLYKARNDRKDYLQHNLTIPKFKDSIDKSNWQINPLSDRMKNRYLDVGDVSPSDVNHLTAALNANVQGVQVDFDDGHCPTWYNQILGHHNVFKVINNMLLGISPVSQLPILMLRPRAWNMMEDNVVFNGRKVPGALFDYAILIFHHGKTLYTSNSGPCFYLSKLECSDEAKLWNDIFTWSEMKLMIPYGSIKACVLIENILAAYQAESILFELKHHSLGLNCGIWDYVASIIAKFGKHKSFEFPDRNKYITMNQRFLQKYLQLIIQICRKRNAPVTGGMISTILPDDKSKWNDLIQKIYDTKGMEIEQGVDGFLVYDLNLIPEMINLWGKYQNRNNCKALDVKIVEEDLLQVPKGVITLPGFRNNISVTILFIYNWLNGKGHFVLNNTVEDSATAEISRSQIWQWIRHSSSISIDESDQEKSIIITKQLVKHHADDVANGFIKIYGKDIDEIKKILIAKDLFFDLVISNSFHDFITTFLYNAHPFKKIQSHL